MPKVESKEQQGGQVLAKLAVLGLLEILDYSMFAAF